MRGAARSRMLPPAMIGCSLRAAQGACDGGSGARLRGERSAGRRPEARHDFSVVQGFQVVGADDPGAAPPVDGEAWRDALRLELETRAARFHHAVDSAIVLSNDGVIRWLGDPVAQTLPGPGVLSPSAVILADESLPDASRETVKTRVDLWIAAMTRRVLAPLFALEALQEGPEVVRDLAGKLARSLGILEREPIRAEIKALAQNERAELRKQGVRFGAYYLFLPALIKPAARTLALQLWSLHAPGDAGELLRRLPPSPPRAGRLSRWTLEFRARAIGSPGIGRAASGLCGWTSLNVWRHDPRGDRRRTAGRCAGGPSPRRPPGLEWIRRQRPDDLADRMLGGAIRFNFAFHGIPAGRDETVGVFRRPPPTNRAASQRSIESADAQAPKRRRSAAGARNERRRGGDRPHRRLGRGAARRCRAARGWRPGSSLRRSIRLCRR